MTDKGRDAVRYVELPGRRSAGLIYRICIDGRYDGTIQIDEEFSREGTGRWHSSDWTLDLGSPGVAIAVARAILELAGER